MIFFEKVLNLIYPPVCVGCGELLDFDVLSTLCKRCDELYRNEKNMPCPICHKPHFACCCVAYKGRTRERRAFHVCEYTKNESIARSLVIYSKRNKYKRMFEMIADDIVRVIHYHIDSLDNTVITYAPRDRGRKAESGVDQAEYTARLISKKLNIPFVRAIKRVAATEQKHLKRSEREVSAGRSYRINEKARADVAGKIVIIYDDLVTTGATVKACASLLTKMGAADVVIVSFARTYTDN